MSNTGKDKKEGFWKTFFTNDWQHGIFVNNAAPNSIVRRARGIIGGQIAVSGAAVLYTQGTGDIMYSVAAMMALLYSVLALSNATKNQRDAFSSFMQSYSSKLWTMITYFVLAMGGEGDITQILLCIYACLLGADNFTGMQVLHDNFSGDQARIEEINEDLIGEEEKEEEEQIDSSSRPHKEYNDRMPEIIADNRMFNRGWKFNLFNVDGQFNKQMYGIAVIYMMFAFDMGSFALEGPNAFNIMTLIYSIVAFFSFFNLSYIRDFDAIQVNITPMIMTVIGILNMTSGSGETLPLVATGGMTAALMADSYFGARYSDESDEIQFNALEQFGRQSWTAQAFEGEGGHLFEIQILGVIMMFSQFAMGISSFALGGPMWSLVVLMFVMVRFLQFFISRENSVIGFQVLQSNMMSTIMAGIGLSYIGEGGLLTAQSVLLLIDAFIGFRQFQVTNRREIQEFLNIPALENVKITNPFKKDNNDDEDDFEKHY